jgi:multidrug efflux system membrane fusion protein
MNIRFPSDLETVPSTASPGAARARGGMPTRTRVILGVVAVAIALFVAWRIFGGMFTPVPKKPVPPVVVQTVGRQDIAVVEHTIGTVVSNATVQLSARIQGQLLKANFKEGDLVKTGQLLFQIDPRPYQAAYNSAMASLASAKSKADRYARLLGQKAIAPQDADDARAAYLEAAALAETARLNLEYTTIRSPIDGKTGPILIQPGNMIMAGAGSSGVGATAAAAPATTLVVITQLQPVKISFSLPQADLPRIQARALAHTLTAAVDNHGGAGTALTVPVDFIGNAVDDKTGTIELRATFQNANSELVPGQLVDIGVTLDAIKGAMVVPHEAINLGPNARYVYAVRDGNAVMVPVTVLHDDGTTAAIEGALKAGDKVVTDGQLRVIPGKPVQISKPAKRPA